MHVRLEERTDKFRTLDIVHQTLNRVQYTKHKTILLHCAVYKISYKITFLFYDNAIAFYIPYEF